MAINRIKAQVKTVTFEIAVKERTFFVLYSYEYNTWYIRLLEAIVYTYTEAGNKAFKGPDSIRASYVLTEYLNLENT
jgi:hypothetical protein